MTCYHPLKAFRSPEFNRETGKRGITFNPHKNYVEGSSISVPCGRCIGCRIDRSQQWAIRCYHESQMHLQNSFITLTYDDRNVPQDFSVKLRDWQLFMYRLREKLPQKIRFFACGEYGDQTLRPHYHALIFNHQFPNLKQIRTNHKGDKFYTSPQLAELWPHGIHDIGDVNYKTAAYTARYVMKKTVGSEADEHYYRRSPVDGISYRVATEFCVQSRRPGIGQTWFQKYKSDAFPSDFVVVDGKKFPVPRYYLKLLKEEEAKKISRLRKRESLNHKEHSTKERLAVREIVHDQKIKLLKRNL